MKDIITNRIIFEDFLRSAIGQFQLERKPGFHTYTITQGIDSNFNQYKLSIHNTRKSGINVSYYDWHLKRQQTLDNIYHWSDAYQLLMIAVTEPDRIIYWDEAKTQLDINATLDRSCYNFVWDASDDLLHISDSAIDNALQLVKNHFITDIVPDFENNRVCISSLTDFCQAPDIQAAKNLVSSTFSDISVTNHPSEKTLLWNLDLKITNVCTVYICNQPSCMIALCGYLEYLYRKDILTETLNQRKVRLEEIRTPCGPYQFTWTPEDGLRFLDDRTFLLANQLADTGMVSVDHALTSANEVKLLMHHDICQSNAPNFNTTNFSIFWKSVSLCKEHLSTSVLTLLPDSSLWYSRSGGSCDHCEMCKRCPISYAGYISYLKESGQETIIYEDREWYDDNLAGTASQIEEAFPFELGSDLFMDVPDEELETALLLSDNNFVSISRVLYYNNEKQPLIGIQFIRGITEPSSLVALREQIAEKRFDYSDFDYYYRLTPDILRFDNPDCHKRVIVLAAYIDYLKRIGQYDSYIEKLAFRRNQVVESFNDSKQEIPALDKVLAIANNPEESGLYCIIEGERGVGKHDIVKSIADLLAQKGKIGTSDYISVTLENISSWLTYSSYYEFEKNSQSELYNQFHYLEPRKLYVFTDLKEFLFECRNVVDGDGSRAARLIKLLGRFQPETYIIIIDEKKYTERFLALSPQINFLFGSNVISVKNPKPEKMYETFQARLSDSLRKEVSVHPNFREQFLDYLALNRKLLPLANIELANYLADYANNQKALVLPPDVYRKRSAKELLQSVIGMDSVKKTAYEFEKYAIFLKRAEMNGIKLPHNNLHMIFTGNPGTGKTMIARVVAQMLFDFGVVKENKLIEVSRKDLVAGYVGQTALKTAEVIDKAMNGVLFVDEAYSLATKKDDSFGEEAIATLIKAMEDHKDKLVVVFAGYEKEMHDFLNVNPGISSRIGYTFHFNDYTADELVKMFHVKMQEAGFCCTSEIQPSIQDICMHFAQKKDFGNGRFVSKLIQRVILKHASRELTGSAIQMITLADIPTIEEMTSTDLTEHGNYEEQLSAFIGMEPVKAKVRQFAQYVRFLQSAKAAGAIVPASNMHMIFTGNPGTGKTTIARVMVNMLYDIGIIRENKLIEVERKDIISEHVGGTAVQVAGIIDRAIDGVLFIDEAYSLASDDSFGREAIATLIKAMEDHKNDLIVIFAGYKDEMRQFLRMNPGIESRIGNVFDFPDYTPEELIQIYQQKMEAAGFTVSQNATQKLRILFEYFSGKKNFGNGRFVSKLQQETLILHSQNLLPDQSNLLRISKMDIPEISDINNTPRPGQLSQDLDSIIGMENVKTKIKEFEQIVSFSLLAREHGLTVPNSNLHMIFTGNPGTGKTTIARMIAQKLYDIGVIKENKLIETERKDLVAGHVGQTAGKVSEIVDKALGGVLFVDEAYTLTPQSPTDFGGEAIATLIKAMEDHKEDLIVIYAGYQNEMAEFIDANPGISSRIGFTFHFPDYSAEELLQIFDAKLTSGGFTTTSAAKAKVYKLMKYFCHVKNFGNGRFADKIVQQAMALHAKNYHMGSVELIDECDIPEIDDVAKTVFGGERMIDTGIISEKDLRNTAIHEAGHALIQTKLFPEINIQTITIEAEGTGFLGYVQTQSGLGLHNTKSDYKKAIAVKMAGLAAEEVILGAYTDGGTADITAAAQLAKQIITQFGMSKYGFVCNTFEDQVQNEVNEILAEGFQEAATIIQENLAGIQRCVEYLLAKHSINDAEFRNCIN